MPRDDLIAALSNPAAYPHTPARIDILHTHASILFFAGTRVYKVKKPVNLGFLDFSTLQRRRHFCEEEVRLNRRLAPDIYLGVVPITRAPAGLRIRGTGTPIEYAVEMVRLPSERMLDQLLAGGLAGHDEIHAIAAALASFHAAAATGPGIDEHGTPEATARHLFRNLGELEPLGGDIPDVPEPGAPVLSPRLLQHLRAWIAARLQASRERIARRIQQGRIREGHGDLHAGNICMLHEHGALQPIIYDCIEFDPALRCCDVASDLAFLAMDLDHRQRRDLAAHLIGQYAALADDHELAALQPLYRCHFALVRAKVEAIRARDQQVPAHQQASAWRAAAAYTHLAAGYTLPPALLLMTGLPGSGKSWLAAQLAAPLGAVLLRSDEVRKELAGLEPTRRLEGTARERLYAQRMTDMTCDELLRRARSALLAGYPVILDGTYPNESRRGAAVNLAAAMGAHWAVVHTSAPLPVIRRRLAARAGDAGEVSDADFMVYLRSRGSFQPPQPGPGTVEAAVAVAPEVVISRVLDVLV
jgi:uncharacterized protein